MNILKQLEYGLWKINEGGHKVKFGLQHVNKGSIGKVITHFNNECWKITEIVNEREFKAKKVEGSDTREYHFRFLKYIDRPKKVVSFKSQNQRQIVHA